MLPKNVLVFASNLISSFPICINSASIVLQVKAKLSSPAKPAAGWEVVPHRNERSEMTRSTTDSPRKKTGQATQMLNKDLLLIPPK